MINTAPALQRWHELVAQRDPRGLDELLDDDVIFHSPVLHTPQRGKSLVRMYLGAAFALLCNDSFRYVRELADERGAVLEFEAEVDGMVINGVDIIRWNEAGKIVEFKVMLRPLKALQLVQQKMVELMRG